MSDAREMRDFVVFLSCLSLHQMKKNRRVIRTLSSGRIFINSSESSVCVFCKNNFSLCGELSDSVNLVIIPIT